MILQQQTATASFFLPVAAASTAAFLGLEVARRLRPHVWPAADTARSWWPRLELGIALLVVSAIIGLGQLWSSGVLRWRWPGDWDYLAYLLGNSSSGRRCRWHSGFGARKLRVRGPVPRPDQQSVATGKVEYDVEHFRPKNRVTAWPTARVQQARTIDYADQLQRGVADGYVRLAFDPWNYGVSCKTCNSELKGDRFPILGLPDADATDRSTLDDSEVSCLLLPVGDVGPDPEDWLEWFGPVVRAKSTLTGQEALRARTVVDFFELDSRPDLLLVRCFAIEMLWAALRDEADGDPAAATRIQAATADDAVFAGCTRAFLRLYRQDLVVARQWRNRARDYAQSKEPKLMEIAHG
ncbi:MAG: hypothetical protein EXS02_15030 [Planctomycetes bacterium]|nr:hypothetical protein [Planctomycetota bacterium]